MSSSGEATGRVRKPRRAKSDGGETAGLSFADAELSTRDALRASEHRFRVLADNISQLAWTCDLLGNVTWYNKRWLDYTGLTFEDMKGWDWAKVQHPDHVDRVVARVRRSAETGEPWEDTFPLLGRDGQYRWFLSRAMPIRDKNGNFIQWFGTNTDVTEQKLAEQKIVRQAEELRILNEHQQMLLNELSHRVKNMLANVQSIAQHTLRQVDDPAEFATRFGGRIHSLSRVHSMLTSNMWQGSDLGALIQDQLLATVDATQVTISGPTLFIEPQMTQHMALMLHEMCTNAIKYGAFLNGDGRVIVDWVVEREQLHLTWAEHGGPVVRLPSRRGFGLALIEQTCKAEGGNARLSVEAGGLVWKITLPVPRLATSSERIRSVAPRVQVHSEKELPVVLTGRRILVVEDEPLIALEIAACLEKVGVEVAGPTGTAREALDIIESAPLDAALLDANLDGRPVDDIAAALTCNNVPFLFVTGYGQKSLPQAFDTVPRLDKPFDQKELLRAAAHMIAKPSDTSAV